MGPRSPEEWENLRRSVVMVGPGQPAQLDRETALALLDALAHYHDLQRRTRRLLAELLRLLDDQG